MNLSRKPLRLIFLLVTTSLLINTGCAEFKSAGKTIGTATKEAATDIGHGTKRVFKEVTEE